MKTITTTETKEDSRQMPGLRAGVWDVGTTQGNATEPTQVEGRVMTPKLTSTTTIEQSLETQAVATPNTNKEAAVAALEETFNGSYSDSRENAGRAPKKTQLICRKKVKEFALNAASVRKIGTSPRFTRVSESVYLGAEDAVRRYLIALCHSLPSKGKTI